MTYTFLGDTSVATTEKVGTTTPVTRYTHVDHLGSTHAVTDTTGTTVQTLEYNPYGSVKTTTGTYSPQRQYIGQYYDTDTSLNYLNARYYDGERGQFVSEDPVFWEIGLTQDGKTILSNPQLANSYSYAGDNPVNGKDPEGRIAGADDTVFALLAMLFVPTQLQADPVYESSLYADTSNPQPTIMFGAGMRGGTKVVEAGRVVNKNSNNAVSEFGIYRIDIAGGLYKYGKADMNRVTLSTGLPTRLHQQLEKLKKQGLDAFGQVVNPLGKTTTGTAKQVEKNTIQQHYDQTGKVPAGNQKSFKPNNSTN